MLIDVEVPNILTNNASDQVKLANWSPMTNFLKSVLDNT